MDEQPEQNQVWRRMPILPCGNCILRAFQELRENSCFIFCITECMLFWVWALEIHPDPPNPVHMWRLMWFKQHSDLPRTFWAEDGHSAPLPCHGKCREVMKTPIFAAVWQCTRHLGAAMLCPSGLAGVTLSWDSCRVSHPWEMSLTVLPMLPVRDCCSELARPAPCLAAPKGR